MPLPPITRFSSLNTSPSPTNNNNGLYVPQLNNAQIAAIPTQTKQNGGIWYNTDSNTLQTVVNNTVSPIAIGAGGGDVTGPANSIANNLATFTDATGKLIQDSGVSINKVPQVFSPLSRSSALTMASNVDVNEIGNLGHIRFTNDIGIFFVDTLMPVEFITNNTGSEDQVCSLFTGGLPSSSTTPSALLELQSDTGALLLSRMTTTERNALSAPSSANGMMLFNTTTTTFDGFDGTNWRQFALFNTDGTLNVATPTSSTKAATKGYVDTAISGSGFAPSTPKYILQTANGSLPNAQALGVLATGLLKNTTTTGVLTIGVAGIDYYSPGNPTTIRDNGSNFFIGTNAGNSTLGGSINTGAGVGSLFNNVSGTQNCSFGYQNMYNNISGDFSSSFGHQALYSYTSTTGYNDAFGCQTLNSTTTGVYNAGFSNRSLFSLTTGSHNSAFGARTLSNLLTGSDNTAFGYFAGILNNSYNNCVFLGSQADSSVNNLTNAIAIGYQASVGASNSMVLGGSGANQLSVGIGVTPNAQLQLPAIHANRKITLYDSGVNNDNQIFAFGTGTGLFRFQLDATTSNYIFYAGVNSTTSNELMRLTGTGFLGIGTNAPNAPLQFPNTLVNRKIVLFETANNDHQVDALGVNSGIFRFQLDATTSNYIFYAGVNSTTSNELMRLTGNGNLLLNNTSEVARIYVFGGVVNPSIPGEETCIRVASTSTNVAKIELNAGNLWELRADNINFVIYLRTGANPGPKFTIDNSGITYIKQSNASYYSGGSQSTTMSISVGTFTQLIWPTSVPTSSMTNYIHSSNGFTWSNINLLTPAIQNIKVSFTATHNGANGEITTFAICKNGVIIAEIAAILVNSSMTILPISFSTNSNITSSTDVFDVKAAHSVASRQITISNFSMNISST